MLLNTKLNVKKENILKKTYFVCFKISEKTVAYLIERFERLSILFLQDDNIFSHIWNDKEFNKNHISVGSICSLYFV